MSYFLHSWELKKAGVEVQCQASELLWQYLSKHREYQASFEEICIMMKCYNTMIQPEWEYLSYTFVDEDGEVYEFNCRTDVNKLMLKKSLYPPFISKAIQEYKNNYKK